MDSVLSISASELHEVLVRAHAVGNTARRRFADALRAMNEQKLFRTLGFSTIVSYGETTFGYRSSAIYDFLRGSKNFARLEKIAEAFEVGKLSWNLAEKIARVATPETEEAWLDFAENHRPSETLAEVQEAVAKGRNEPRKSRRGLPGLNVELKLRLSAEQHAVIERGLEKIGDEMSESLEGERPSPEQALLYLMDRVLKEEGDGSPYQVVFHKCTECESETVEKSAGRVEVPDGELRALRRRSEHARDSPSALRTLRRSLREPAVWAAHRRERARSPRSVSKPRRANAAGQPRLRLRVLSLERPRRNARHRAGRELRWLELGAEGGGSRPANPRRACGDPRGASRRCGFVAGGGRRRRIPELRKRSEAGSEDSGTPENEAGSEDSGTPENEAKSDAEASAAVSHASGALRVLGYSRGEAERRVRRAAQRLGRGAAVGDLIRAALTARSRSAKMRSFGAPSISSTAGC